MNQHVTIGSRVGLRCALLDLLGKEARDMADAAAPPLLEGERNHAQARDHWLYIAAVARLLDDIGWFAATDQPYDINIATHAWATVRGLEVFIANQEKLVKHEADLNDPEAAGDAMGRREDARKALTRVEAVCARVGISVSEPSV